MIAYLKGKVERVSAQDVVLNVNDVGYLLTCTTSALANLAPNQEAEIIVHTDVQETSIRLYGFLDNLELEVFKLLISVSGTGAKSAVDILSKVDKTQLLRMLSSADSDSLKKIKGVGPKTADRLILELKDKVANIVQSRRLVNELAGTKLAQYEEAKQALQALGFNQTIASQALDQIKPEIQSDTEIGEVVRMALAII